MKYKYVDFDWRDSKNCFVFTGSKANKMENKDQVKTLLIIKSSAKLMEEVEDEIDTPDPEEEEESDES